MIYLDNAATMPVYPEAIDAAVKAYSSDFFNPSATYSTGITVHKELEAARAYLSTCIGCSPCELYFTSGATEANNWALSSSFKDKKNGNIVISNGEHACVFECAKAFKASGADARTAPLNADGTVDLNELISLVDEKTCLVSVIHTSNETGAINDLAAISRAVKLKNPRTIVHSDGVQAFLKTDNSVSRLGVDMYTVSGHKVGAPKGVGFLYISSKINVKPFIYGGGQERGMRSGTENVAGILALAKAAEVFKLHLSKSNSAEKYALALNEINKITDVTLLGGAINKSDFLISFSAKKVKAEIIQTMCADDGVIIGRGSACSSKKSGNRVLAAMGVPQQLVDGALRLSFSPDTTEKDILDGISVISKNIEKLRGNKIG